MKVMKQLTFEDKNFKQSKELNPKPLALLFMNENQYNIEIQVSEHIVIFLV